MSDETMTLEEAVQKAAAELPDDAEIQVCVENGAGWVDARNWYGDPWDEHQGDMSLAERVLAALQWCKDTAPKTEPIATTAHAGDFGPTDLAALGEQATQQGALT